FLPILAGLAAKIVPKLFCLATKKC
uniref:Brevinin-1CSa n=1 Tax=Rana cascadae TaxID=160497 RepID=BR1A_RANCS|nr:RecName: Full=Brevinin-1CSa [Rana cascadae]